MKIKSVLYLPDGNRRYAKECGVPLSEAYLRSGKSLKEFMEFFVVEQRSKKFIVYATTEYTPCRTDETLAAVYDAVRKTWDGLNEDDFFKKNQLSLKVINHSKSLPQDLIDRIKKLSPSEENVGEVIWLFGYSLKEDYNNALSYLLKNPPTIPEQGYDELRRCLLIDDIDLFIRNLESRPSGCPTYAMSQAQMMILNKPAPEITRSDLEELWEDYCRLREYRIESSPYHVVRN